MRKPGFPIRSDTDRTVQPQKMTRGLKFRIYEVGELFYLCSGNKGAHQIRVYSAFVFAYAKKKRFSHDAAEFLLYFLSLSLVLQKGIKNVFEEAILAALESPKPVKKKKCVIS